MKYGLVLKLVWNMVVISRRTSYNTLEMLTAYIDLRILSK